MKDHRKPDQHPFSPIRQAILVVFVFVHLFAPGQEKKETRNFSVLPVPAIGYSPETKTYIGAVTLFTFNNPDDSLSRTSNAKIEFNYTWNKQVIVESGWNYFSPGEKWFTRGLLHYSKYPDLYYGIGFETPEENEVSFQSNRAVLEADAFRNVGNKWFAGAGVNFKSYNKIEYLEEGDYYPELSNGNNFGVKIMLLKDSRNNILTPSKGNYLEFSNSFNFSESFYSVTTIDFRKYLEFGKKENQVLAGRIYHSTVWGNPPFYDYAEIGGDKLTRGYYLGRFRDKNLSTVQLEYRNHLFWRIGMAAFGGISMVYEEFNKIQNKAFKPNAGLGLRFLVDKKENTNLRIDYALGREGQSGFYISFGESF